MARGRAARCCGSAIAGCSTCCATRPRRPRGSGSQSFRATRRARCAAPRRALRARAADEAFARAGRGASCARRDAPTGIIASNSDITLALLRIFIGPRRRYPRRRLAGRVRRAAVGRGADAAAVGVAPPVGGDRAQGVGAAARADGRRGGRRRHIALAATLVERASLAPPPAEPARRRVRARRARRLTPRDRSAMRVAHVPTSAALLIVGATLCFASLDTDRQVPVRALPDAAAGVGALDDSRRSPSRRGSRRAMGLGLVRTRHPPLHLVARRHRSCRRACCSSTR